MKKYIVKSIEYFHDWQFNVSANVRWHEYKNESFYMYIHINSRNFLLPFSMLFAKIIYKGD